MSRSKRIQVHEVHKGEVLREAEILASRLTEDMRWHITHLLHDGLDGSFPDLLQLIQLLQKGTALELIEFLTEDDEYAQKLLELIKTVSEELEPEEDE